MAAKTFKPEDLAKELGVSGKVIRAWLRANHARPASQKRQSWVLSEAVAKEIRSKFADRKATKKSEPKAKKETPSKPKKAPMRPKTRVKAVA